MYSLLKPLLFKFDPEQIHNLIMSGLSFASAHPGLLRLIDSACALQDDRLKASAFDLDFPNPIGLAAGFDKNAKAINAWEALGFGFVEVGSVTRHAQAGNPKPRLFRLPSERAIINRMGFNNDGADALARKLKAHKRPWVNVPLGINLGKSKITELQDAPSDYLYSLQKLYEHGDYFVVNVSSPNTVGLRKLQDRESLEILLSSLMEFVSRQAKAKPLLLKIAPDLSFEQVDEILHVCESYKLSGIIATNTTLSRENLVSTLDETGGLSGKPLNTKSLEILKHIRKQSKTLPIVSVGGISSANDIFERLKAGASLVQLYTSLVYEGPLLLKKLTEGLLKRLEQEGISSVAELLTSN